jgi:hypothetical protein
MDFKVSCSQIPRRDSNPRPFGLESDILTIQPRRSTSLVDDDGLVDDDDECLKWASRPAGLSVWHSGKIEHLPSEVTPGFESPLNTFLML